MLLRPWLVLEADLTCCCEASLQQAAGQGTVAPVRVVVLWELHKASASQSGVDAYKLLLCALSRLDHLVRNWKSGAMVWSKLTCHQLQADMPPATR
jgi:hypothetical protein